MITIIIQSLLDRLFEGRAKRMTQESLFLDNRRLFYERFHMHGWGGYFDPGSRLSTRIIMSLLHEYLEGSRVFLDVGGGTGSVSVEAIKRGISSNKALVLDLSVHSLEIGKKNAAALGVSLNTIQCDALNLPLGESSVDVAVYREVLEHLPDDQAALVELRRVLKPGGVVVFTSPIEKRASKEAGHLRCYTEESFRSVLESSGLKVERVQYTTLLSHYLWTYPKHFIIGCWLLFTGNLRAYLCGKTVPSYYATSFHQKIVMPIFDRLVNLDYMRNIKSNVKGATHLILVSKP